MNTMEANGSSEKQENTSKTSSQSTAGVRQPVSCEPCRKRKIKCSRSRPPCTTCQRRGCAKSCTYAGREVLPVSNSNGSNVSNEELLSRISNLENLLRQQTGVQLPVAPANINETTIVAPTVDIISSQSYSVSPGSLTDDTVRSQAPYTPDPAMLSPNHHIGSLTTSNSGNVQYEPRSSQWNSVLANARISSSSTMLTETEQIPEDNGFPFMAVMPLSLEELIAILPPMRQCEYLKDTYFEVFSPLFHILHDPTFHAEYSDFVKDPFSVSLSWLAILFVILSLAVTTLETNDSVLRDLARGPNPCSNIAALGRRYREGAMRCLTKKGVIWGRHDVQSLQALIMLGYAMNHNQEHTWVLLGMTYNVAIAIGCHVDPANFNLSPIQCEERRRCFAGLTMLYTIQNTALGNSNPSCRLNHDVNLPADLNDVDITMYGIQQPAPGPTQMSYLLFKFQLYDLTASICQEVMASTPSRSTVQALDQQICAAQELWDARYMADSSTAALPAHHAVHLHILHGYAHQLFLLLHRPFFAQSVIGLDIPNESQIRCIASAEALLDIHKLLCETSGFRKYIWYTNGLGSFHAFHAAAVLAVALEMSIYQPQWHRFRRVLGETLIRFEALAERSKICAKATKILKFLLPPSASDIQTPNSPFNFFSNKQTAKSTTPWSIANEDDLNFLSDCLQPQQWLGPGAVPWDEWDLLMSQHNDILSN